MHVATVTIDHTKVAADLTDYVVAVICNSDAGWDALYAEATEGGGDIRVFKNDDTTELAREKVTFSVSAETGEIYIKYSGTLSSSVDTDIHIYADGTSSDYAATDTYGRNAVWSGHSGVWHGDGTTDSKAETNNLTLTGSGTYTSGKLGQAFTTSARNQYWRTGSSPTGLPSGGNSFSLSYWLYWDGTPTGYNMPISWGVDANNTGYFAPHSGATWPRMTTFWGGGAGFGYIEPVTPTFSTGTWIKIDTTYDTTANVHTFYANGASIGSVSYSTSNITNSYFNIAKHMANTTNGIIGSIDEVRVINNVVYSANWVTTEYNNQNSPSTFYGVASEGATVSTLHRGFFALLEKA